MVLYRYEIYFLQTERDRKSYTNLGIFSLLDMHYKTATRTQSVVSNDSGHGSGNELDAKPSTPVKLRRHEKYGIVSDYYDALLLV